MIPGSRKYRFRLVSTWLTALTWIRWKAAACSEFHRLRFLPHLARHWLTWTWFLSWQWSSFIIMIIGHMFDCYQRTYLTAIFCNQSSEIPQHVLSGPILSSCRNSITFDSYIIARLSSLFFSNTSNPSLVLSPVDYLHLFFFFLFFFFCFFYFNLF